ncbi:relaxase MobL [Paenibacillus alvei]|uniref:Relaxase MobL n=1 Tax=Paenibacillus alvei TaxID=44250 RepID=A0ABT4H358_PAEAL|nr:MobP3 family relaxase [Paenibacillus alvei]MCY9763213.1 relaxase MobL [Paenibacillus alvei]MCY9769498.1 relaxase MobL [Paenibacillus alvei]
MTKNYGTLSEEHARFQAPFVCKIRFYIPERGTNVIQSKNAAHIGYIATRPGSDFGDEEKAYQNDSLDFDKEIEGEFHEPEPGTAAGHVKYADERPGSHGLFSYSDEKPNMREVQKELEEHKGIVYRVVLSLTEEDAKRVGFTEREKWENALRASVPEAAAKMGIPETNLNWVAAFHQEKGHPHVHLVMWEKNPVRRRGILNAKLMEDVKRSFAREVFAEERMILNQEKTATREYIRGLSKDQLGNVVGLIRDVRELQKDVELEHQSMGIIDNSIAPKLYMNDKQDIADRLNKLGELLPDRGRIAFQYMSPEIKLHVLDTTRWLLDKPAFFDAKQRYLSSVEWMTRQYSFKPEDIQKAKDKAMADLEKRVAQVVLRAAAESKKDVYLKVDPQRAALAVQQFSKASGRIVDTRPIEVMRRSLEALREIGCSPEFQHNLALKWLEKAEIGVDGTSVGGLINDVNSQPRNENENAQVMHEVAANVLRFAGQERDSVKNILERAGIDSSEIDRLLKASDKNLDASAKAFISERDWKRFTSNMGIKAEYPWEIKEDQIVIQELKQDVLNGFRKGKFNSEIDSPERGYIAFCMTVALKQLGVSPQERKEIMTELNKENHIPNLNKMLKKVDESETNFLRKGTWEKICNALNQDLNYPWITQDVMGLNVDKFNEAVQKIDGSDHKINEIKEAEWTAKTYISFLKNSGERLDIRDRVETWARTTQNLPQIVVDKLPILEKRSGDIEILAKQIGIRDQAYEHVKNFAKILFSAGLEYEQVKNMVVDWNHRSGSELNMEKITESIEFVEKQHNELKIWGRTPVVSKKDYESLTNALGAQSPYIWVSKNSHDYNQSNGLNIAKKLWKSLWNGLDQERNKTLAQGEMLRRRNEKRLQREAQKEQEKE